MFFSRFFKPKPAAEISEAATLSEMKALTNRLSGVAFREFTAPPSSQAGGRFSLGMRGRDSIAGIRIVPVAGVKVP